MAADDAARAQDTEFRKPIVNQPRHNDRSNTDEHPRPMTWNKPNRTTPKKPGQDDT